MKEHFRRLGVREDASWEEIEDAFNRKIVALRSRTYPDDPKGKKKDKDRRLLIRSYYALQEYEANGRVVKKGLSNPHNRQALILLVIILFASVLWYSCDRAFDEAELELVASYDHLFAYDQAEADDLVIADIAKETVRVLDESGTPWHTSTGGKYYSEPEAVIRTEANSFAQIYWGLTTIEQVHEYLCDTYENYEGVYLRESEELDEEALTETTDLCMKIDMICAFYGFYTKYQAFGKKDPYTKKGIGLYHTYLQFLNQYYEDYNKG